MSVTRVFSQQAEGDSALLSSVRSVASALQLLLHKDLLSDEGLQNVTSILTRLQPHLLGQVEKVELALPKKQQFKLDFPTRYEGNTQQPAVIFRFEAGSKAAVHVLTLRAIHDHAPELLNEETLNACLTKMKVPRDGKESSRSR